VVLIVVDQNSLEPPEGGNQLALAKTDVCADSAVLRRGGSQSVAFDILFTEPSSYRVEDDKLLAEALQANGQAFCPIFLSKQKRSSLL